MPKLNGQVVLITGAARGIGARSAKRLVGKDARVVLVDLDEAPLQALAGELGAASAVAIRGDVCDLASMGAPRSSAPTRSAGWTW